MPPIRRLALVAMVLFATSPACSDDVEVDFLGGDSVLPGDPIATTADGRVHVLVSVDGMVHVESGEPGGTWLLESLGVSDQNIDFATLTASGDTLHAVWGDVAYSLEPKEVFYTARMLDGWSEPVDLTADLPSEMRLTRAASIAASSTGELVLVWSSRPAGAFAVARVAEGRLVGDPELVPVSDEGACDVTSRPAFDSGDRLIVAAHCTTPNPDFDTYPPELIGVYVARDAGDGWDVALVPGQDGQPRIALGPDDTVHAISLTSWRCGDDNCRAVRLAYSGGRFGEWPGTKGVGSAAFRSPVIAVDEQGGVYVAFLGASQEGDASPCAKDGLGCFVTSADGSSFTTPSELPAAGAMRSQAPIAMVARGVEVVLVDCVGEDACERLAVSTLAR